MVSTLSTAPVVFHPNVVTADWPDLATLARVTEVTKLGQFAIP
jgi:hypothetical protein